MSYAFDANVLLYASDRASPFHRRAVEFLGECASRGDVFYVAWPTAMAYLRIATHPAIFRAPLAPDEALRNVESLLRLPHARFLGEEEGFRDAYRRAAHGLSIRGNLVPDAHLAALLLQHGVRTLYTSDAGFRRFAFLDVRNPFA
ncbi:MAG: TA system VapC family ribonuclease toxin [Candidatus Rokuibacteriota bacterium]